MAARQSPAGSRNGGPGPRNPRPARSLALPPPAAARRLRFVLTFGVRLAGRLRLADRRGGLEHGFGLARRRLLSRRPWRPAPFCRPPPPVGAAFSPCASMRGLALAFLARRTRRTLTGAAATAAAASSPARSFAGLRAAFLPRFGAPGLVHPGSRRGARSLPLPRLAAARRRPAAEIRRLRPDAAGAAGVVNGVAPRRFPLRLPPGPGPGPAGGGSS